MSIRISCKQRVSHQCGKACDISVRLAACKRSCTDCRQRASLPWTSEHVLFENMFPCGGIFALFVTIRLFSGSDSHVDSKPTSLIARVVALWTNKRFLSAVNSHVGFQIGKFGTRVAALIAIVIFLCIRLDVVDFGHLGKFWFMICVFSVCWRLQSIGITEKNKLIWPGTFHEKWKWHATMMTMMMMMMGGIFTYGRNTYRYLFRRYSVRTPSSWSSPSPSSWSKLVQPCQSW